MLLLHFGILAKTLSNSGPFMIKIWTRHDENLDQSWWKSWPFIMKILICLDENFDCSSWKSRPVMMKTLIIHHEDLHYSSWKFWLFIKKILIICHKNISQFLAKMTFHTQRFNILYTIDKVLEQPGHFTCQKLHKCSQIPHPSPRATSNSNRTKDNHHWLNHLKTFHMH